MRSAVVLARRTSSLPHGESRRVAHCIPYMTKPIKFTMRCWGLACHKRGGSTTEWIGPGPVNSRQRTAHIRLAAAMRTALLKLAQWHLYSHYTYTYECRPAGRPHSEQLCHQPCNFTTPTVTQLLSQRGKGDGVKTASGSSKSWITNYTLKQESVNKSSTLYECHPDELQALQRMFY